MYWLWLVGLCHIDGKSLAHVRSGVVFRFLEVFKFMGEFQLSSTCCSSLNRAFVRVLDRRQTMLRPLSVQYRKSIPWLSSGIS